MPKDCPCGSGLPCEAEYDGQGIFLDYVCEKCRTEKLGKYRPEILGHYTQADVDERIEEDV